MTPFRMKEYGPLAVITFTGACTDADFQWYLDRTLRFYQMTTGPVVIVMNLRSAPMLPASQRKMQADWGLENASMLKERCMGIAFVSSSAVARFVLSSIFLVSPMPASSYVVCARVDEGIEWAGGRLLAAGIDATVAMKMARESTFLSAPSSVR